MKTAGQLGIPEDYRQALIKTLDHMQSGKMRDYTNADRMWCGVTAEPDTFNMVVWACGTTCCIGGTAEHFFGRETPEVVIEDDALDNLFHPPRELSPWSKITLEQGISALRNYLETGNANWTEVLKG